ncbi:MAG: MFS transporter, partial [Chloroflexota bacterium]
REVDVVGAILSILGMGGIVLSILVWQEGGEAVGVLMVIGLAAMFLFASWLVRRKKQGKPALIDPDLFKSIYFRLGITEQMLQNISLGGMMIALPIYFQMVFEYTAMETGFAIAPMSLSIFAVALLAGRKAGKRRPSRIIQIGFGTLFVGVLFLIPLVPHADSGLAFLIPLMIAGSGLGLLVSQLNNYTLSPISEERVSEAAGVNSASGSFGLSFGLAFAGAMMLATLAFSFTNMAEASTVLTPEQQVQVAQALEVDAEIMSNTQLEEQLVGQPPEVQAEIIRINAEARFFALQVALMVPLLAALLGFLNSFRMVKLPDLKPSSAVEGLLLG